MLCNGLYFSNGSLFVHGRPITHHDSILDVRAALEELNNALEILIQAVVRSELLDFYDKTRTSALVFLFVVHGNIYAASFIAVRNSSRCDLQDVSHRCL